MGLLKGTLTFSPYRITGDRPDHFGEFLDRRLKKFAFRNIFAGLAEEKTVGWAGVENILDADFQYARYTIGKYVMFSLRIDRKIVPPALLKIRVLEAERDFLADKEQKKIHRLQREEIRERVRLDLLSSMPPVPSFIELCWSPEEERLLFCSLSEKVMDDFRELFKQTFELTPQPFVPWEPPSLNTAVAEQAVTLDPLSIGREFLTWLWFKSEERSGMIAMPGQDDVEIAFIRRIVLESGEGEYAETVVCQGLHAGLNEGREALRRGKKIREARIRMGRNSNQWEFTFKADRFQFQSLKLPVMAEEIEDEQDRDGRILERIYLMQAVIGTMEELFALFLKTRLSALWETEETTRMKRWLEK